MTTATTGNSNKTVQLGAGSKVGEGSGMLWERGKGDREVNNRVPEDGCQRLQETVLEITYRKEWASG